MEILRVPPYPISTSWNLPIPSYTYTVYVEDLVDHSVEVSLIDSDENGVLVYELPLAKVQFDRKFLIRFYDTEQEHILYEENLDIIRPYVNPTTLGTTASEITQYKTYEMIARSIIDTIIEDGFYNHKSIMQIEGNGADYMPVWRDANRVLKVYENNVLVFDAQDVNIVITGLDAEAGVEESEREVTLVLASDAGYSVGDTVVITNTEFDGTYSVVEVLAATDGSYAIKIAKRFTETPVYEVGNVGLIKRVWTYTYKVTLDNSAIVKEFTDSVNRIISANPILPISRGDLVFDARRYGQFPKGNDYIFVLDEGHRTIPVDVEQATLMLIDDLKCGNLDYYKRYVTSYNTDQFRVQFDKQIFSGTGNVIVDKVLEKYKKSITKLGVL